MITDINAHLHTEKPAPFAEMERIIRTEGEKLFPFFVVRFDANLCHSLYIWGSFDAKETWYNGYRENSRMFASHVFCASQWYREHPNQYFKFEQSGSLGKRINGKMIARKDKDFLKLTEYIVKQLKKIAALNETVLATN
jgi:hypothetical protein